MGVEKGCDKEEPPSCAVGNEGALWHLPGPAVPAQPPGPGQGQQPQGWSCPGSAAWGAPQEWHSYIMPTAGSEPALAVLTGAQGSVLPGCSGSVSPGPEITLTDGSDAAQAPRQLFIAALGLQTPNLGYFGHAGLGEHS